MCFGKKANVDPELRFWVSVKSSKDGCWEWQSYRDKNGYGSTSVKGVNWFAHRLSWLFHFGPIPDGMGVLHKCDNPPCVRPDHLFLGTQTINMLDMLTKGREARGERRNVSNLTAELVIEIRREYAALPRRGLICAPNTAGPLADKFGISKRSLFHIVNREVWTHLED